MRVPVDTLMLPARISSRRNARLASRSARRSLQRSTQWCFTLALALVVGCAAQVDDSRSASGAHDTGASPGMLGSRAPHPGERVGTVVLHETARASLRDSLALTFADLRVAKVIGRAEGPEGTVFGLIADARQEPGGRTFVLDARFQRISIHDSAGVPIAFAGRPGRGPGEFREPGGLTWREGLLLALDVGNMRIQLFEPTPQGLSFVRSINLPFMARSFCTVGSRIFVSGLHEGRTVHEIGENGVILNSFGEAYGGEEIPPGPLRETLRGSMSTGVVACSAHPELIVAVPRNRPEVTAYSSDGQLRWRTSLARYSQMMARMTERGTMQYAGDSSTGGQHTAQGILLWPPEFVLVQLAFLSPSGYRVSEEAPPETRVLDLRTGRELGTVDGLPRLVAVDGSKAIGFSNIPFPYLVELAISDQ